MTRADTRSRKTPLCHPTEIPRHVSPRSTTRSPPPTPGHTTTWTDQGIEVTVYGQRRYELNTPTPWAHITINGKIRAIRTWDQLLDYIDALAAEAYSSPVSKPPGSSVPIASRTASIARLSPMPFG
ncbi:hypothetical protein [Microbacterium sp. CH12i]|uniref:hypothetical protein n=1 Tax=Microbacterium sp. CH12i TaxID=1479651 RepID=UPI0012682E57|nr:hypothetical protein [Microbacterium sp. CH12i]